MSKAEDTYRMWHAKEPNKALKKSVKALDEKYACSVGTACEILYSSKKWEKQAHDYIHDFGTPKVYFLQSQANPDEVIGRPRSVCSLINTKSKSSVPEMALLAKVKQLSYKDKFGEIVDIVGISGAQLLCTPDRKGLLLLTKKGPIFIRGGKMRVSARGIVD